MIFRHLVAVILFLLSALPATAVPLTVSGRVVDAAGEPVADATVRLIPTLSRYAFGNLVLAGKLEPEAAAEALTGDDGSYRLEVPEPGKFQIRIDARGFAPVEIRHDEPLAESIELPTAELVADAGLEVRITDPDGRPLAGAWLSARVEDVSWRLPPTWDPGWQNQRTDETGKARLARGREESLALRVHHPDFLVGKREQLRSKLTVALEPGRPQPIAVRDHRGRPLADVIVEVGEGRFAQGKTDDQGRLVVPVPAHDEIPIRFETADGRALSSHLGASRDDEPGVRTFELPLAAAVDGRVVDAASQEPVPGALIWESTRPAALVRSDRAGGFHLPAVAVGQVRLKAIAPGYFPVEAEARTAAGQRRSAPTMALAPAGVVTGTVVDEDGQPVVRAEIVTTYQLTPTEDFHLGTRSGGTCFSDRRGRFQTPRLLPEATYQLRVTKPGYAAIRDKLSAPHPHETTALELVLRRGRLGFGTVVDEDDRPVAGAEVTLERQQAATGLVELTLRRIQVFQDRPDHGTTSDAEGRFEFPDVGAGRFQLTARAPGYAPTAVPGIEIPSGAGRLDLGTVVLSPGVTLTGRVVDSDSQPVAEAEIIAKTSDGTGLNILELRGRPAETVADVDGYFALRDRRRGEKVDLAARRVGFTTAQVSGIEAPPEEPVVLTMEPASVVSGRVLDPEDGPVAEAKVILSQDAGMAFVGATQTDAEGRFRIPEVRPGTMAAMVIAEGWQTAELANIEVLRGRDLEDLEIRLLPGGRILGTVRTPDGQPVIGAEVRVAGESRILLMALNRITSDGEGHYQLSGVEPGKQTIEVSHGELGRASKTLEVTVGEHRLDFVLAGGFEISGQVVDPQNTPVSGARVWLSAEGFKWWSDLSASSGEGGRFAIPGVPDGTYTLHVTHPGYGDTKAPEPVVVAGQPVQALVIRLETGAVITGRLLGIDFEALAGCRITASSAQAITRSGEVDFEGRYRVLHAGPGTWLVRAETETGRTQGTVTVTASDTEVELDLEFRSGHTLIGRVHHQDRPLDGATVILQGIDVSDYVRVMTDHRGRFEVPGLAAGRYGLNISDRDSEALHQQELEISSDRELDIAIAGTTVTGRVIDAESGEPVAGVELRIAAVTGDAAAAGSRTVGRGTSDQRGFFRLGELTAGPWRIVAEKSGYSPADKTVQISPGDGDLDLELALVPSEGLVLTIARSDGAIPAEVAVAVVDGTGQPVVTGDYPVDVEGRVLVSTVPAGRWDLLVRAEGTATVHRAVTLPGDGPRIDLMTGATLEITIPAFHDQSGHVRVEITGRDGRPFRDVVPWSGVVRSHFDIHRGRGTIRGLPAGTWQLIATAPDGASWSTTVTTTAGKIEQVWLE